MITQFIMAVSGRGGGTTGGGGGTGDNTILAIWTEDIARDWVRIELANSAGGMSAILPDPEQWTITGSVSGVKTVIETTNPRYINGANLKIIYIKVDSDFVEGEEITLSYTSTMDHAEMNGLQDQENIPVENNITDLEDVAYSGTDLFSGVDDDSIYSNKLVKIASGDRGYIDIGRADNLLMVCADDDEVHMTYVNVREAVLNARIVGHPARVANLKIHETYDVHFGIGCFATGNLQFEDLEIYDHQQGIQVKTVSDLLYPPYNLSRTDFQNLTLRRFKIKNVSEEALYIGADVAAPLIPITWTIEDGELIDIGKDCVQVRNGGGVVKRVIGRAVDKDWVCGNEDADDGINGHFCTFGTTSDGCVFEDCNTDGTARACGFFINGYGEIVIKDCNVTSFGRTVTMNNYNDLNGLGATHQTLSLLGTNRFECIDEDPYSLDVRRDAGEGKLPTTLNISAGTTFVNNTYVEDMPEEEFPPSSGTYRGGIVVVDPYVP